MLRSYQQRQVFGKNYLSFQFNFVHIFWENGYKKALKTYSDSSVSCLWRSFKHELSREWASRNNLQHHLHLVVHWKEQPQKCDKHRFVNTTRKHTCKKNRAIKSKIILTGKVRYHGITEWQNTHCGKSCFWGKTHSKKSTQTKTSTRVLQLFGKRVKW